ncbi:hypothetical protein J4410_01995 [Candidatus Woesearchaeota archaeon]|nr:hypothetical protein [Candidatus Woesearchaeota archaeon]
MFDLTKKQAGVLLIGLFLAVASLRVYLALSVPSLTSGDAYHHLGQIESLQSQSGSLFANDFSYRAPHFFLPGYQYILSFFSHGFSVLLVLKVVPNIFIASLVFPMYLLIFLLSRVRHIALTTSFGAAFVPILWSTLNTASPMTVTLPLILWLIYAFFRIKEHAFQVLYFTCLLLLLIIHPSLFLILLGFLFYFVLLKTEKIGIIAADLEVILFSLFLVVWAYMLLFKKLFLAHGIAFIWLNLPQQLISDIFARFSILEGIYTISLVPFFAGIFSVYYFIFRRNYPQVYLMIALSIITTLAIWFGFYPLQEGLMLLGLFLVLLASFSYTLLLNYAERIKYPYAYPLLSIAVLILIVFTSLVPSLQVAHANIEERISEEQVATLTFLREQTHPSAIVFADIQDGYLLSSLAQRRNVIEPNFLLSLDASERYQDMKRILSTLNPEEAYLLLDKYGVDYVYVSPSILFNPEAQILKFDEYPKCFQLVYDKAYKIYYLACGVSDV